MAQASVMAVCTRFAPSPTGRLHLGHALAAMVAHDLARESRDGTFLLRFEDIDRTRVREDFYRFIEEDLLWLGIHWNGPPLRQTTRNAAYDEALSTLRDHGLAYPCFCTRGAIRRELNEMPGAPHDTTAAPYPGTCRRLSPAEQIDRIDAGEPHAWRLDAAGAMTRCGPLEFTDSRHGTQRFAHLPDGDVILARKDIGTAYHLAVVVDDAFQQITHVTRGEDLLPATRIHRVLQHLLGLPVPVYLHHPLVTDDQGTRLAKRHDALSLARLRESGTTREQILAMLAPWRP